MQAVNDHTGHVIKLDNSTRWSRLPKAKMVDGQRLMVWSNVACLTCKTAGFKLDATRREVVD